jgi:hypothetical protein
VSLLACPSRRGLGDPGLSLASVQVRLIENGRQSMAPRSQNLRGGKDAAAASGSATRASAQPTAARRSSKTEVPRVRVRTLDDLARKYDFTPPDEFVGSESSRHILDYGRPIILSDSSRESYRSRNEREVWRRLLADSTKTHSGSR